MKTVAAIFLKDALIELRLRQVLPTMIVLAVVLVTALGAFLLPTQQIATLSAPAAPATPATPADPAHGSSQLPAAVAWLAVTFAALLAAERAFAAEREDRTLAALLAAPIEPAAIFLAKSLFVLMLITGLQLLVIPLTAILLGSPLIGPIWWVLAATALADISLAVVSTASAALVAEARLRGPLLSVIALPLMVPVLLVITTIFTELAAAGLSSRAAALMAALALFNLAFLAAAILLFPHIMEP